MSTEFEFNLNKPWLICYFCHFFKTWLSCMLDTSRGIVTVLPTLKAYSFNVEMTSLKWILDVHVWPWYTTGSPSLPSQVSTSTQRQPLFRALCTQIHMQIWVKTVVCFVFFFSVCFNLTLPPTNLAQLSICPSLLNALNPLLKHFSGIVWSAWQPFYCPSILSLNHLSLCPVCHAFGAWGVQWSSLDVCF